MAFVQVELDAIKTAQLASGVVGLNAAQVIGGLTLLWAHCFNSSRDTVSAIEVEACFCGGNSRLCEAMVAFGFLETCEGQFRVRGAERYLRISESKKAAGKARAASAKRGSDGKLQPAGRQHKTSTKPAGDQQATSGELALTPITDHRSPITDRESKDSVAALPGPTASPPEPKPTELVYRFWEQRLSKPKLEKLPPEVWSILGARFREGLTVEMGREVVEGAILDAQRWPERAAQNSIPQLFGSMSLVQKYADLARKGNPRPVADPEKSKRGIQRAEEQGWEQMP